MSKTYFIKDLSAEELQMIDSLLTMAAFGLIQIHPSHRATAIKLHEKVQRIGLKVFIERSLE